MPQPAVGKDSSASTLKPATDLYAYALSVYGTQATAFGGNWPMCTPAGPQPGQADCVFDTYIPGSGGVSGMDQDWRDYYHGEFRGFAKVSITRPDGNLTVESYYGTEGWGTPPTETVNANSGQLIQQDIYAGTQPVDGNLLRRTTYQYPGDGSYHSACHTAVEGIYAPCLSFPITVKTTWYEENGTGISNAPWVQTTSTYDDYDPATGLNTSHTVYHNLLQQQTSGSNIATVTQKWTYSPNDFVDSANGNYQYYTVGIPNHGEVDDSNGHVWLCTDVSYDEGAPAGTRTPAAGWPTTVKSYSDCANQSQTLLKNYLGYDAFGNPVATVDPFGVTHSNLYSGNGCTLATMPAVLTPAWTAGHFTSCTVYDTFAAQPLNLRNVLSQTTSYTYDETQGRVVTSTTDMNGQTVSIGSSYDGSGNATLKVKHPLETGDYTSQSSTHSTCVFGSSLPCYEIDHLLAQYPGAVTRTFYDVHGRAVETRTPLDATHDLVSFTVYNESNGTTFQSVPFRVASGSAWLDPNGAVDDQGHAPAGTITSVDALGRVRATADPLLGTPGEPGQSCAGVSGTWTSCTGYGLGQAYGDSATYGYAAHHDPNNHLTVSYANMLGRTIQVQSYSQPGNLGANITAKKRLSYNVLGQVTSALVKDLAPQSGQSIIQVQTTATYDDLGRLISSTDPDRGTHSFSYDEDGRLLTDVTTSGSNTRTLGTSYDLLGRVRCVQDAAPTTDGSGNCSSGSHPLVQNTYGQSFLGTQGSSDFPVGRLTQTVATTSFPDGASASVTQQYQHDQRGRVTATKLFFGLPVSWNVTAALPSYQLNQSYNDADQPTTTQTQVGGQTSYTFSQAYDSTTGVPTGLSNTTTAVPNLATLGYDVHGQLSDLNFQTTTGTALATAHFDYDGNLRPATTTASWQSGSGSSGTIFSTGR
ncbi:MAG: RHS repeat protein, partial [Ktedonobacteraceae bacterium]|nr:RHS repeat protein [Ktedonobacteraceae bacterium]